MRPIAGCPRVTFAVDLVRTTHTFLTPCHYTQKVRHNLLDVNSMGATLPLFCLRGVASVLSTSIPLYHSYRHWMGHNRTVWLVLDRGSWSTEALGHTCMFSHCCINYGWNTDSVSIIYAWPTRTLTLLAISKTTDIFLPGQEKGLVFFL